MKQATVKPSSNKGVLGHDGSTDCFEEGVSHGFDGRTMETRRAIGSDGGWHMKAKHETIRADRLFYCFVDFGKTPNDRPTVHVLPSRLVAEVLAASYSKWLATPGKKGQPHKESIMRRLLPDYTKTFGVTNNAYPKGWLDQHRDAWHLLALEPTGVELEAD